MISTAVPKAVLLSDIQAKIDQQRLLIEQQHEILQQQQKIEAFRQQSLQSTQEYQPLTRATTTAAIETIPPRSATAESPPSPTRVRQVRVICRICIKLNFVP